MAELSYLEIMERYGAFGPDFLTWLAVRTTRDDLPAPPSEPGLKASVHGPMVFESSTGEATRMSLAGEEAASAPEVRAALRAGKRLARSRVEFTAQDATWTFTLDAATFDLRSVKLPVPKIPDLDEYFSQRIQALQHLDRLVRELFELFLPMRLDPSSWKAEVAGWRDF